jgi:hypothetical protein
MDRCLSRRSPIFAALCGTAASAARNWGINAIVVFALSVGLSENARSGEMGRQSDDTLPLNPPLQARNITPHGRSPYFFPLVPAHKHILEMEESGERYRRETTVLDQIDTFYVEGIGRFATAVVREEEFVAEELVFRVERWLAIDGSTRNVHIFGEVSWLINGKGHARLEGIWRAGEPDDEGKVAQPGLLIPGTVTVGSRLWLQGEGDGASTGVDVVAMGINVAVPAGTFVECVRFRKDQPRGRTKEGINSIWCPQVGLVYDTSIGQLISSNAHWIRLD